MISLEKIMECPEAIEKAKKLNPEFSKISPNVFRITGSKKDIYEVRHSENDETFNCNCPAGKLNKVCYHTAAILYYLIQQKQQAKQQPRAAVKARLSDFIDFELLNRSHKDFANFMDICCTIEISDQAAAWFALPEEQRPRLFADFAGF